MTNYSLERRLRELDVPFARAKVGDRYVLEMLEEKNWLYGGEGSGHLLCLDCHTTGDGIVSALQVLSAVRRQNKSLSQLTQDLVLMPQALVNATVERGFEWRSHAALVAAVSDAEPRLNFSDAFDSPSGPSRATRDGKAQRLILLRPWRIVRSTLRTSLRYTIRHAAQWAHLARCYCFGGSRLLLNERDTP